MVWYQYSPTRRLKDGETADFDHNAPSCPVDGSRLLRLAERNMTLPYNWKPIGRICDKCGAMYVEFN